MGRALHCLHTHNRWGKTHAHRRKRRQNRFQTVTRTREKHFINQKRYSSLATINISNQNSITIVAQEKNRATMATSTQTAREKKYGGRSHTHTHEITRAPTLQNKTLPSRVGIKNNVRTWHAFFF